MDSLKSREQDAFRRKQDAWQKYANARDSARAAHDEMESAWQARCSARDEMNREYETLQASSSRYHGIWSEYNHIRDQNNYRIESLRREADSEHYEMQRCFDQASSAYEYGDKSMAPIYAQEGRNHKERRDALNAEVSALIQEIRNAKTNAECRASRTDASAFHRAQEIFGQAKNRHESAQANFKRIKNERDQLKAAFDSAQAEHTRLKEEFQRKLAETKATNRRERDRVLDKAGVRWSDRKDAKIIKKADGTTQIYHGGLGSGDGFGHGHTALDKFGNKTYSRDAFEKHGHQNYTDDKALSLYPSRGQWSNIHHGWLEDHKITWCEGTGVNAGQTLICDGWVDTDEFNRHHDHYGPDSKYASGKRIEDITDSLGRKKFYSGPGH